jgi:hypothetical protein
MKTERTFSETGAKNPTLIPLCGLSLCPIHNINLQLWSHHVLEALLNATAIALFKTTADMTKALSPRLNRVDWQKLCCSI